MEQIKEYLQLHGISPENASAFDLELKDGEIAIPVKDTSDQVLFYKHRHFTGNVKYTYDKGASIALFGINRVNLNRGGVYITEGEMDAMALWAQGKNAVSSTGGAGSWQESFCDDLRSKKINILYDNDPAGLEGMYKVWRMFMEKGFKWQDIKICALPDGSKDVGEFLGKGGKLEQIASIQVPFGDPGMRTYKAGMLACYAEALGRINRIEQEKNGGGRFIKILALFREKILAESRILKKRKKREKVQGNDLDAIKRIPITNFVKFQHGKARCVFHNEKTASMIYNDDHTKSPNTVKCFGCGKFGTVIDVVMAIWKVEFKEAVETLKRDYTYNI